MSKITNILDSLLMGPISNKDTFILGKNYKEEVGEYYKGYKCVYYPVIDGVIFTTWINYNFFKPSNSQ